MAYASAWSDADRHLRMRMGTMLGRTKGGNPARRCDLVPTRKETLARRHGDPPRCRISPSSRNWTGKRWTGWRRSPTSSTRAERKEWGNDDVDTGRAQHDRERRRGPDRAASKKRIDAKVRDDLGSSASAMIFTFAQRMGATRHGFAVRRSIIGARSMSVA